MPLTKECRYSLLCMIEAARDRPPSESIPSAVSVRPEDVELKVNKMEPLEIEFPAEGGDEEGDTLHLGAGVSSSSGGEALGRHDAIPLDKVGSTIGNAMCNFMNSIIGAGIIGLPYALNEAGIGAGLILLVGVGIMTDYSVRLLVDTGVEAGNADYEGLCHHCFGTVGFYVVSVFMSLFAFGAMVAYNVIIGDTLPVVLGRWAGEGSWVGNRAAMIILCNVCVILPLCLQKDMGNLSKTSLLSISAVWVIVLTCCFKAPGQALENNITLETVPDGMDFVHPHVFEAIGAMAFAFVCHHSSFLVRNSMANPTPQRWTTVTHISVGMAILSSVLFSTTVFSSFLSETKGDCLNNFPPDDEAINMVRLCLAFTMFFTYPMELFVMRQAMHSMIWPNDVKPDGILPTGRHLTLTLSIWSAALITCMLTSDLGIVLELSGGLAATVLGWILPGACALKIRKDKGGKMLALSNWREYILIIFGAVVMVCATTLTITRAIEGGSESEGAAELLKHR